MGKKRFVRASFVPSKLNLNTGAKENGGVYLCKNGRAFLLLEHDEERNKYLYHGMVAFYRDRVPDESDEEFVHLYEADGKKRIETSVKKRSKKLTRLKNSLSCDVLA